MKHVLVLLALGLAACGVNEIGRPPSMTSIGAAAPDAQPILTAERAYTAAACCEIVMPR